MATHKALILEARDKPLRLTETSTPQASPGSVIINVLAAFVSPHARKILKGALHTPLSTPTVPSSCAIGRVSVVGPDAVSLQKDQLVFTDFCITARDNPNEQILQGYMGFSPKLDQHWRSGTYAECACVPLERCWPLNEELLTQRLKYSFADLAYLPNVAIPHAGLQEMGAQPGDTIIVAPATGFFGGIAVHAALACGAKVIAAGRNVEALSRLQSVFNPTGRIATVTLVDDVAIDSKALIAASGSTAGADKYVDFSPPQASKSIHFESCIKALRPSGVCSLMGSAQGNVGLPYSTLVLKNIRLQGRLMFNYGHAKQTIRLVETGMLKLGPGNLSEINVQSFKLDEIEKAMDEAERCPGWGNMVVLEP